MEPTSDLASRCSCIPIPSDTDYPSLIICGFCNTSYFSREVSQSIRFYDEYCVHCGHRHADKSSLTNSPCIRSCKFVDFEPRYICWSCGECTYIPLHLGPRVNGAASNWLSEGCRKCGYPADSSWVLSWLVRVHGWRYCGHGYVGWWQICEGSADEVSRDAVLEVERESRRRGEE